MPAPEADAIRADVLLCTQRQKESEALLETVLAADPKNAQAHETMGMLKFSAGDTTAARKWFSEAVELDSRSYLAHYYFAVFALEGSGTGQHAAIERSLRTSITLNPLFAPSYDALAHFYCHAPREAGRGIQTYLHGDKFGAGQRELPHQRGTGARAGRQDGQRHQRPQDCPAAGRYRRR